MSDALAPKSSLQTTYVSNLISLTDEQLLNLAKYDLLITASGEWNKEGITRIRAMNPNQVILGYFNINATQSQEAIDTCRTNGWLLKDINGNEVVSTFYDNMYFWDIGNLALQDAVAEENRRRTNDINKIQGVFGDNMGVYIDPYANISGRPVNPRTGIEYTDQEWQADMVAITRKIKAKVGKLYVGNNPGWLNGNDYLNHKDLADPLLSVVDGVCIEGFIRWIGEGWRPTQRWVRDLQGTDILMRSGKFVLTYTQAYGTLPAGATPEQIAMYGFATYLLVKQKQQHYFRAVGYSDEFYNIAKTGVGVPLENYHARSDILAVYEREFSLALVMVNPTDNGYDINLTRPYKMFNGQLVTRIHLSARTGIILLK